LGVARGFVLGDFFDAGAWRAGALGVFAVCVRVGEDVVLSGFFSFGAGTFFFGSLGDQVSAWGRGVRLTLGFFFEGETSFGWGVALGLAFGWPCFGGRLIAGFSEAGAGAAVNSFLEGRALSFFGGGVDALGSAFLAFGWELTGFWADVSLGEGGFVGVGSTVFSGGASPCRAGFSGSFSGAGFSSVAGGGRVALCFLRGAVLKEGAFFFLVAGGATLGVFGSGVGAGVESLEIGGAEEGALAFFKGGRGGVFDLGKEGGGREVLVSAGANLGEGLEREVGGSGAAFGWVGAGLLVFGDGVGVGLGGLLGGVSLTGALGRLAAGGAGASGKGMVAAAAQIGQSMVCPASSGSQDIF
jgi:hypothetical protein